MAGLKLSGETPFAMGGERAVYLDPTNPERLIKVLLPKTAQNKGGLTRSFFTRFANDGHRRFLLKQEYREYLRVVLQHMDGGIHLPIAHMYGFVETDLGMGCATQCVHGVGSKPARNWKTIASEDVTQRDVDALSDFCRRMLECGVRSSDLTSSNVVLGHRTVFGEVGPYEAVLIDGYGDTHLVPVRSWSGVANRNALRKRIQRLGAKAGLTWNVEKKRFEG